MIFRVIILVVFMGFITMGLKMLGGGHGTNRWGFGYNHERALKEIEEEGRKGSSRALDDAWLRSESRMGNER